MDVTGADCFSRLIFSGTIDGSTLCGSFTDDRVCLNILGTVVDGQISGPWTIESGCLYGGSGTSTLSRMCVHRCFGDKNRDGMVTVDEIIEAVNNVLGGCPEQ